MTQPALEALFERLLIRGEANYGGEPISQLQHALQTAALAEAEGAPLTLLAAALLHDIGHLADTPPPADGDDHHEARAVALLTPVFGPEVWQPVRWHVAAKRWLVLREPHYRARLSAESIRSLTLQGGPMTQAEAQAFEQQPYAEDAIRLRRWDDAAKDPDALTPDLGHYCDALRSLVG